MQVNVYTEPEPLSKDFQLRIFSNPICPYVQVSRAPLEAGSLAPSVCMTQCKKVSPFSFQRVRLLAAHKGIKTEEINIHLKVKPDWYLAKVNPVGKVPTIEHNGHYIPESLIAFGECTLYLILVILFIHLIVVFLEYIDEVFGDTSVWPKDPYLKAKDRLFVNDFDNKVCKLL